AIQPNSVGKPVAEIEVIIKNCSKKTLKPNIIGDIWMRGPTLFSGYFNDPKKTAEVISNGWVTVGDVGYVDEDGFLFLVDRKKDIIISGGTNIYPIEIEEAILKLPFITECAVVGVPDPLWGEAAHAYVVVDDNYA